MLGIILCDDDPFILNIEKERIGNLIKNYQLEARIVCVSTHYQDIMNFLETNPMEYLFFMDLDFGEGQLNGIDIAKLVKNKIPLSKIVFRTNHHEMALEVLKSGVEPFGFIEKSTDFVSMDAGYAKYIQMALANTQIKEDDEKESQYIELVIGIDEKIKLPITNILYVEAVKTISHGIAYHTIDGSTLTVRDSIENVLEKLGEGFMKSHRSVIVHKKYLIGLDNGMVRFANGEQVPCSFRLRNEVKKVLIENTK